jgi:hypothetical protein
MKSCSCLVGVEGGAEAWRCFLFQKLNYNSSSGGGDWKRGVLTLVTHANTLALADRTAALERKEWEKEKGGLKFKKRGGERLGGKTDYKNHTAELEAKRLEQKEKT